MFVAQSGEAPTIGSASEDCMEQEMFVQVLVDVGFESVREYEEVSCSLIDEVCLLSNHPIC